MTGYNEKDAAKDTGVSVKEVNQAWHDARDDAMKSGELNERKENKQNQANKNKEDNK